MSKAVQFEISDGPIEPRMPTSAEIIPHPQMGIRFAEELFRAIKVEVDTGRLNHVKGMIKDAVVKYRKRLVQLGVKPERVAADVAELETYITAYNGR